MSEEKQQVDGNEMSQGRVQLKPGLWLSTKLEIASVLELEERFQKPILDIDWEMLSNSIIMMYYLARQENPDLTEDEFKRLIAKLSTDDINEVLKDALKLRLKNSPRLDPKELEAIEKIVQQGDISIGR